MMNSKKKITKTAIKKRKKILNKIEIWRQNPHTTLYLSRMGITELPPIPHSCQYLDVSYNKLINLPELPCCQILYCN